MTEVANYTKSITSETRCRNSQREKKSVDKLTNTLISGEQKGNEALPHHDCSGSRLFCTSSPTTPPPRTQIQSEAAKTREKNTSEAQSTAVKSHLTRVTQPGVNATSSSPPVMFTGTLTTKQRLLKTKLKTYNQHFS